MDIENSSGKIFLIGTPNHGNLGDHAIAYASVCLLEKVFPGKKIEEVNMAKFWTKIEQLDYEIEMEDLIVLQGGGNCGNRYMDDELIRRYVIEKFINNIIILFPQSFDYSYDASGRKELNKAINIYSKNKNLYLLTRDENSYKFVKDNFKNKTYLVSDIVLSLNRCDNNKKRKGVLVCLRDDGEGILSSDEKSKIIEYAMSLDTEVTEIDTCVDYDSTNFNRQFELEKMWDKFQQCRLVITDRLHGMMFSAITGTACLVIPTINTKVTAAYETISHIKNISLVEDISHMNFDFDYMENDYSEKDVTNKLVRVLCEIVGSGNEKIEDRSEINLGEDYIVYLALQRDKILDDYKERIHELQDYSNWIDNLKEQGEKDKSEYLTWIDNLKKQNEDMRVEYSQWVTNLQKQVDDRMNELMTYKDWVNNLQKQNEQLHRLLEERKDEQ